MDIENLKIGDLITDGSNMGYVREISFEGWPVLCEVLMRDYASPNIIRIPMKDIYLLTKLHFRIMKKRKLNTILDQYTGINEIHN